MLLKRTKILQQESLASYIYRLSRDNYYESPFSLHRSFFATMAQIDSNQISKETCETLAILTGYCVKELHARSTDFYKSAWNDEIQHLALLRSRIKYCPICIQRYRFHKLVWNFNTTVICIEHNCLLLDRCQKCKKKISMGSYMKGHCNNCSFEFSLAQAREVQENQYLLYEAQKIIQDLLLNKPITFLLDITYEQLLLLIKASKFVLEDLNSFIEPFDKKIHTFLTPRSNMYYDGYEFAVSVANIIWMYEDFPVNFYNVLDAFHLLPYNIRKRRMEQFKKCITNNAFVLIQEALKVYKEREARKGRNARNVSYYNFELYQKEKQIFYNKRDIISKFNISEIEIRNLINKGVIQGQKIIKGKQVDLKFLVNEVNPILENFEIVKADILTKKEVAEYLGISVETVSKCLNAGLLREKNNIIGKRISKTEVEAFLCSLNVKTINVCNCKINFKEVFKKYTTNGLTVVKLLEFILEGKLQPFSINSSANLLEFYFDKKQLRLCLNSLKMINIEKKGYSLSDVARKLGISERTLHKMVQKQMLQPRHVDVSNNGRIIYAFDKSEVDLFRACYISVPEASNKYQISQNQLRNYVYRGMIFNYMEGTCSKILLKVEELERLLNLKDDGN